LTRAISATAELFVLAQLARHTEVVEVNEKLDLIYIRFFFDLNQFFV